MSRNLVHLFALLAGIVVIVWVLLTAFGPWGWFVSLVLLLLAWGERRRSRSVRP